jgi:glycosyltransferase involved in cell wall biosynthesis
LWARPTHWPGGGGAAAQKMNGRAERHGDLVVLAAGAAAEAALAGAEFPVARTRGDGAAVAEPGYDELAPARQRRATVPAPQPQPQPTVLLCDPMCVLPYGHNVSSLVYYRKLFRPRSRDVICLGCRGLPSDLDEAEGLVRFYEYYYDDFVPLPPTAECGSCGPPQPKLGALLADPIEAAAVADSRRALDLYRLGGDDVVLFPSADFYGVAGMLAAIAEREPAARPRLYLRFIGVMEGASKFYPSAADELLRRVAAALAAGLDIRPSAETPAYADMLGARLDRPVRVTPWPPTSEAAPYPAGPPFLISAIGSARRDKGFFQLFDILSKIRVRDPGQQIRFCAQLLPDRELEPHRQYASQLYALPGMRLLPASLPGAAIQEIYRTSHVILLPYDVETYRYRGSAVAMEAAAIGRPVLTYPGTGFALQVQYYGLGRVCKDNQEMADAVFDYISLPQPRLASTVRQARFRFFADAAAAYDAWMQPQ